MKHTGLMRILSLLPSATEIVYALGLEDQLVGVTHECDWPAEAREKPVVTSSALAPGATPSEIDRLVSASIGNGSPIYRLDEAAVRELKPDLVISQDLCAVCAVPSGLVDRALGVLGCTAEVLSLDPGSLEEVLECILRVGQATGRTEEARAVLEGLHQRMAEVEEAVAGRTRPRTFALEWADPPFNGGHWVSEMIERGGGEPVLARRGEPSVRIDWGEVAAAAPEVVVFMPCGYGVEEAARQASDLLLHRPELSEASAVFAADANAYFSRPGPRLVDGVELLASALHPGAVAARASGGIIRLR